MKILIAGVSGSGKTTVGKLVAARLGCDFADADDFHPPESIAKMRAGIPLNDADRAGWLEDLGRFLAAQDEVVLACSALKRAYRDRLRELGGEVQFFVLSARRDELERRLEAREHYMPASLLGSQLTTLELGDDMVSVENEGPAEETADWIVRAVGG